MERRSDPVWDAMVSAVRKCAVVAVWLALLPAAAFAGPRVFAESPMVKVRPTYAAHADSGVRATAARNEFVSFQVVVHGADTGATHVRAALPALSGPSSIGGADVTLYREAFLNITTPTGPNTITGRWPDALVPDVDEISGERRNAFPFDVPRNEARAIWIDVHVPADAPPGAYSGAVHVTADGGFSADVPVSISVVRAQLPSTPSLSTAFRLYAPNVCRAHTGLSDCGGATMTNSLIDRYERMALEHRFTVSNPFQGLPPADWSAFDTAYAKYLDGTSQTRLSGARMTSAEYPGARVAADYARFAAHFEARGWLERAFDYTADEPPYGVSYSTALQRANLVKQSAPGLRTLITTTLPNADANGLTLVTDIMVPVVNWMDGVDPPYVGDQRPAYDGFLGHARGKLWLYQSCMSHGCAYGTTLPENRPGAGWPSYMVDVSAAKNRAMEWISFLERASGELYYETAMALPTAWTNVYQFSGNGDGTLFYPGTPAMIGGTTNVPVASIRMKMIRLGMQDYEWLKMVADAGDPAFSQSVARGAVPTAHDVPDDGAAFEHARSQLISRYLDLTATGSSDPISTPPSGPVPDPGPGSGHTSTIAPGGDGASNATGGCSATGAGSAAVPGLLAILALRQRRRARVGRARDGHAPQRSVQ